jgi:general secretion pathway protein G
MNLNTQTPSRTASRNARRAFTLLEIMVVIAIIGLLVGVAVNGVQNALEKSRRDAAKLFINATLKTPLGTYRIDNGSYPSTADGLQALLTPPVNGTNWRGPYLEVTPPTVLPNDPWGYAYRYEFPGTRSASTSATTDAVTTTTVTTGVARYDLWSVGADGIDGTADDVGNW